MSRTVSRNEAVIEPSTCHSAFVFINSERFVTLNEKNEFIIEKVIWKGKMDVDCGYCYDRIAGDDFLECEECEQYVHVRCLRRPGTPGDFIG